MKLTSRHGKPAFTLIELMAVITIIVILAALVVAGLGFVTERQAKEKARVQIALLTKGLEEYKLDNGTYPISSNSQDGSGFSDDLYIALFYEGYEFAEQSKNGNAPDSWTKVVNGVTLPKATKIYLPDLDPTSSKQGWVDPVTGDNAVPPQATTIKDPWGNPYRYRSGKNAEGKAQSFSVNPEFDLWTSGKDSKTNTTNLNHKDAKDDIRNF
ncbi:MAG: prepilin-type N-terminal cleavage/methylation domain-containing protein [Verrucomicrobiaceae bacterium]|nr:MAG: prepilin-type N-terminal cleavage/methylation domain-containing protein [Verrucomicrobiaceae bacterium]